MKTKVLQFICPTGYYGAERWITALVKSLDTSLIESHVCITLEAESATDIVEYCEPFTSKIHQIDMNSKFDIRVVNRLVRIIKNNGIDIIHTHGYKSDIIGVIAGKIAGIKTLCTPHGFENTSDWKLRSYMWLGGKAFHYFDKVCPLSPQIELDLLNKYHVKPKKIKQVINGVDLIEINEAMSEALPKTNNFTIGYIGQLISRKNIGSLIKAFALFSKTNSNAELIIIGDGEDREQLEALSRSLSLTKNVRFLGFLDNRLAHLPSFNTFTLTSSLEGIPRCLMEAMAAEACVTAYDIPGVDQLIINNETGLSVPFNDEQALSNAWQKLVDNQSLEKTLAIQGKEYVQQNYSAQSMAHKYQGIFKELTANKAEQYA